MKGIFPLVVKTLSLLLLCSANTALAWTTCPTGYSPGAEIESVNKCAVLNGSEYWWIVEVTEPGDTDNWYKATCDVGCDCDWSDIGSPSPSKLCQKSNMTEPNGVVYCSEDTTSFPSVIPGDGPRTIPLFETTTHWKFNWGGFIPFFYPSSWISSVNDDCENIARSYRDSDPNATSCDDLCRNHAPSFPVPVACCESYSSSSFSSVSAPTEETTSSSSSLDAQTIEQSSSSPSSSAISALDAQTFASEPTSDDYSPTSTDNDEESLIYY